jgi:hypothetical protein
MINNQSYSRLGDVLALSCHASTNEGQVRQLVEVCYNNIIREKL